MYPLPTGPYWLFGLGFGLGAMLYSVSFEIIQLPIPSNWFRFLKPIGGSLMVCTVISIIIYAYFANHSPHA